MRLVAHGAPLILRRGERTAGAVIEGVPRWDRHVRSLRRLLHGPAEIRDDAEIRFHRLNTPTDPAQLHVALMRLGRRPLTKLETALLLEDIRVFQNGTHAVYLGHWECEHRYAYPPRQGKPWRCMVGIATDVFPHFLLAEVLVPSVALRPPRHPWLSMSCRRQPRRRTYARPLQLPLPFPPR